MNKSLRFIGLCVSLLVFVAFLGALALTSPHGTPAVAQPATTCPCDFNDLIPKTKECWTTPYKTNPEYVKRPNPDFPPGNCITQNGPPATQTYIGITEDDIPSMHVHVCVASTIIPLPPGCPRGVDEEETVLYGPEELKACQCELLAYVTSLNEVDGISVSGGPPYECGDVDCPSPIITTPIPALNEWGLIAMVGILGIVGFMILRRRKVNT